MVFVTKNQLDLSKESDLRPSMPNMTTRKGGVLPCNESNLEASLKEFTMKNGTFAGGPAN